MMPMLVKVMNGEASDFNVYGTDSETADGSAIRDFIHVTDLARGHIAALAASSTQHGLHTFNPGTGTGYSVLEVVSAMEKASRKHIPLQPMGRRAGDVASCVAEPLKAWIELGWKTEKTLRDCCEDMCHFLKQKALP
jgi:UDP-glucose 4-epimerase